MGQKKKGPLPEGGEMLILAFAMFAGVVGTVVAIWFLAPAP